MPDSRLSFVMTNDSGYDFGLGLLTTAERVAENRWTHVAVTRSADSFRIFINGKQVAERTASDHITQPYNPVTMLVGARFASDGATPADHFHGRICDFRMYSRPLAAAEIPAIAALMCPWGKLSRISDRVMEKRRAGSSGEVREIQNSFSGPNKKDSQPAVASPLSERPSEVRETGLEPAPPYGD